MNDFSFTELALMTIAACLLDRLLGETPRFHPLVGFGQLASHIEQRFNIIDLSAWHRQFRGLLCWLLLVLLPALVLSLLLPRFAHWMQTLVGIIMLYLVLGGRSLQEHAARVCQDLQSGNLPEARTHVSWLVSRDTRQLDETGISKACIESVLENGNDAVFAPIFWFLMLGPAGAILYRLANTLDAMWGYRTDRYLAFGRATAQLDDVLNYVPSRLTAVSYALAGKTAQALRCWHTQAKAWDSPNAGPVMSSGAGALNLQLGGAADYHGATEVRPKLGAGRTPIAADIPRAQSLVRHALLLWLAVILFASLLR